MVIELEDYNGMVNYIPREQIQAINVEENGIWLMVFVYFSTTRTCVVQYRNKRDANEYAETLAKRIWGDSLL